MNTTWRPGLPTLRNVVLEEECNAFGRKSWVLLDPDGEPISSFRRFYKRIQRKKLNTRLRYVRVVAAFIDYLYEARVLGRLNDDLPSLEHVNDVIDAYPDFLAKGSPATLQAIKENENAAEPTRWLIDVALALNKKPLAPKSFDNTLPPINEFLRLSVQLADAERDKARRSGIDVSAGTLDSLIQAVDGAAALSVREKIQIRNNSLLGGVIRMRNEKLERPCGLGHPAGSRGRRAVKDFPLEYFGALMDAATCWRDRVFWLLTLASGIRPSEALNVTWADIDWANRDVYVEDPHLYRMGRMITDEEALRFKGRQISWTYLFEPFRSMFFEALLQYQKLEYVLPADGPVENGYVLQKRKGVMRGRPLRGATDSALNRPLHRAIARARIPLHRTSPDDPWDLYSFRHAYGMYMLNDAIFTEVDGTKRHLTESEVQVLMGHKYVSSTRQYARRRDEALKRGLELSDLHMLSGGTLDVAQTMALPRAIQLTGAAKIRESERKFSGWEDEEDEEDGE